MKRFTGILLIVCGSIVMLWTLLWLFSYFHAHGISAEALSAIFGHELLFWSPVGLFFIPGFLLIQHGRRLLDREQASVFAIGEVTILFAIIGIILALMLPMDNFSFTAASIVTEGIEAAAPAKAAVESHHAAHGTLPASGVALAAMPAIETGSHVRSIAIGEGGRVVITYDTRDIHWGWHWWHYLLFRQPNDLTGLTLVLVPSVANGAVTWDECAEGSVPLRNRHYRCSHHQ
ncbi:MAG: hypothetical protein EP312_03155 [Gammaproteobacteria bacterium]|nr:MAG: hypothetical protein EP312_03155 [Gammaproteobacteria bacterium]